MKPWPSIASPASSEESTRSVNLPGILGSPGTMMAGLPGCREEARTGGTDRRPGLERCLSLGPRIGMLRAASLRSLIRERDHTVLHGVLRRLPFQSAACRECEGPGRIRPGGPLDVEARRAGRPQRSERHAAGHADPVLPDRRPAAGRAVPGGTPRKNRWPRQVCQRRQVGVRISREELPCFLDWHGNARRYLCSAIHSRTEASSIGSVTLP